MSIIFDFCIVVLLLGIIGLLLVQAFSYAIPSLILGLIGAQIASIWLIGRLRDLTGIPIDPYTHTHTHTHTYTKKYYLLTVVVVTDTIVV
jgi:hypothetical protein